MKIKTSSHLVVYVLSLSYLIGITFTFMLTFLYAYLSPVKKITININRYGEANFELMFFSMCSLFCVFLLYDFVKKILYSRGVKLEV